MFTPYHTAPHQPQHNTSHQVTTDHGTFHHGTSRQVSAHQSHHAKAIIPTTTHHTIRCHNTPHHLKSIAPNKPHHITANINMLATLIMHTTTTPQTTPPYTTPYDANCTNHIISHHITSAPRNTTALVYSPSSGRILAAQYTPNNLQHVGLSRRTRKQQGKGMKMYGRGSPVRVALWALIRAVATGAVGRQHGEGKRVNGSAG
jgi:hypothetical protein